MKDPIPPKFNEIRVTFALHVPAIDNDNMPYPDFDALFDELADKAHEHGCDGAGATGVTRDMHFVFAATQYTPDEAVKFVDTLRATLVTKGLLPPLRGTFNE